MYFCAQIIYILIKIRIKKQLMNSLIYQKLTLISIYKFEN